jgi:hypothetical protein
MHLVMTTRCTSNTSNPEVLTMNRFILALFVLLGSQAILAATINAEGGSILNPLDGTLNGGEVWAANVVIDTDAKTILVGGVPNGAAADDVVSLTGQVTLTSFTFSSLTVNAVTVTVTGSRGLILATTGDLTMDGIIKANGANGTGLVTGAAAAGGAGGPGGGDGGITDSRGGTNTASAGSLPTSSGLAAHSTGQRAVDTENAGGSGGAYGTDGGDGSTAVGSSVNGGLAYGDVRVTDLFGGTGGGGGHRNGDTNFSGGGGGGGGGAVQLVASGTLTVNGSIDVSGGDAGAIDADDSDILTTNNDIDDSFAGLFGHWDAVDYDGTTWVESSSGSGGNLVNGGANKPAKIAAGGPNNLPYADFDGSNRIWSNAADITTGNYTVFFIGKVDVNNGGYFFDASTGSQRGALLTDNRWHVHTSGGGSITSSAADFTDDLGLWALHTVQVNGASSYHAVNGVVDLTGDLTGTGTFQTVILGARYTQANRLTGGIAEFLIYDGALSASEIAEVESSLMTKHGLGVVDGTGDIDDTNPDLFAHYDATDYDGVTWTESSSGAGVDLTLSTPGKPAALANGGPNNQPYADFNGSQSIWGINPIFGGVKTVFFVARMDSTGGYIFDGYSGTRRHALLTDNGGVSAWHSFTNAGLISSSTPDHLDDIGNWVIHTMQIDNANSYHAVNGIIDSTGNLGAGNFASFMLGNRISQDVGLDGGIAEVLLYDRALTADEIAQVERSLGTKHGIDLINAGDSSGNDYAGGGGSGGAAILAAPTVNIGAASVIDATGGTASQNVSVGESGTNRPGGGGGGGRVAIYADTLTNAGTVDVAGGAASDFGAGAAPTAGTAGSFVAPGPFAEAVPTLSQWGMIILTLLIMSGGIIQIVAMFAPGALPIRRRIPFDSDMFAHSLRAVLVFALVGAVLSVLFTGTIAASDIIGGSVTIPVLAYFHHLLRLVRSKMAAPARF